MEPAPGPVPQPDSLASEPELRDVERRQLINQILQVHKDHGYHEPLSPVTLSVVWLADLDCLRSLVESFELNFESARFTLRNAAGFVSCWTTRRSSNTGTPRSAPSTPIQESSPQLPPGPRTPSRKRQRLDTSPGDTYLTNMSNDPIPRCKETVGIVHKRDKTCNVTKATNPTISAHIVPYAYNKLHQDVSRDFWAFLKTFWGNDQAEKWRGFIERKTTESIENHILLSPGVHAYWDEWLFALEPVMVSIDKKVLFMRFHWLCPGNLDSLHLTTQMLIDPNFTISHPTFRPVMDLSRGGRDDSGTSSPNLRLVDCDSCRILQSGDVVTVTTDDPESLPLPSFEILQLQWILHRVRALAAAAGFHDEFSDDDDDYGLGEDPHVICDEDIEYECDDYFPRKHSVDSNMFPSSALWES